MKRNCRILTVLAVLLFASSSYAEPTVQDWIKSKDKWVVYVVGVGTGISYANAFLAEFRQRLIYCPPDNLSLEVQNNVKIMDVEIQKNPEVKLDTPLGAV